MKTTLFSIGMILFTGLFFGCNDAVIDSDSPSNANARSLSESEKALSKSGNQFSFDLFRELTEEGEDENIFISPLSVSLALAMVLNGAEGETFNEIKQALDLGDIDLETINENYHSLIEYLKEADQSVDLAIANSVWHENRFSVNDEFLSRLEEFFNATAEGLDFSDPASTDRINNWVSDNTKGLIESIVDEIPADMVMYLINALYFKGEWLIQFDEEVTHEADFILEDGNTTAVEMMMAESAYATFFSEDIQMIEVPYGDSLFTMTVIMPADMDQPLDLFVSERLNSGNLDYWAQNLRTGKIQLRMPKFQMEYDKKLNDILVNLGMELPFDPNAADLSGISSGGQNNLFISEVIHKTFLEVSEEGSEAAAVTSVGVQLTSAQPSVPRFTVNRPFVFLIREQASGTVLFMGKMKNPGE